MAHRPTRREMLATTGLTGMAALTGVASSAGAQTTPRRPRIACLVSYWGATRSHADWIVTKLIDGYWWQGAHTPSRVDVAAVYMHQRQTSTLGEKVCKAKGIPVFDTVAGAVTLGGKALAVDGVVIVGEHGDSEVAAFSTVRIGGQTLDRFCGDQVTLDRAAIARQVPPTR